VCVFVGDFVSRAAIPKFFTGGYRWAMTGSGRRNAWLRMTDMMGLTEPGKKAARPSRRVLVFWTVLWSLNTVLWLSLTAVEISRGSPDYLHLILAVISIVLAVAYFVMWLQSKKTRPDSNLS
jgi:hypothetical protein